MEINGGINTINGGGILHSNYRALKDRFRQSHDDNMYYNMGYNVLLSIFSYDERIYRPEIFESILHDTGACALIKTELSDYTPVFVSIAGGRLMPDGMLEDCICFDMAGNQYNFKNWRNNPDVLVFFNNLTYTADDFLSKYAYMLTNVDTSLDSNVIFSRLKPVPVAKDTKTKNQIDAILNDLLRGKITTVLAESAIRDIVNSNKDLIEVINLTDVESSKYLQYLQNLHDSLISRMFFHMGLSISDNGKQAQISIEELNKNKSASLSILNGWYAMRKKCFDEAFEKTGVRLAFDFSEIWKSEWEYQTNPQGMMEDESVVDSNQENGEEGESSDSDE